jgi:uncharacterized protein YqeY
MASRFDEVPMSLKEQVNVQLKEAMKAKDSVRLDCLRSIIATVKNREIEKRGDLDDAEIMKVLQTLGKQRLESIDLFRQGGRMELAAKEEAELVVIRTFLPQALSEAELATIIDEAIAETEAQSPKDMGKVMKAVTPKIAGRADGKAVSDAVKAKLSRGS